MHAAQLQGLMEELATYMHVEDIHAIDHLYNSYIGHTPCMQDGKVPILIINRIMASSQN